MLCKVFLEPELLLLHSFGRLHIKLKPSEPTKQKCYKVYQLYIHTVMDRELYEPPKFGDSIQNYSVPKDGTVHLHCPVLVASHIPISFPLVSIFFSAQVGH